MLEELGGSSVYNPKLGRKKIDDLLSDESEVNALLIKQTGLESKDFWAELVYSSN